MKRMSAPPSSIKVAAVWRNMWHEPFFSTPLASTAHLTRSLKRLPESRSPSSVTKSARCASSGAWLGLTSS